MRTLVLLVPLVTAACGGGTPRATDGGSADARPATDAPAPDAGAGLADRLEPIRAAHGTPALAALLAGPDGTIASGATGTRQLGGTVPVTIDDRFHLGSDTKAMTATLIAMLVDEGALAWDDTLGELFADFDDIHPDIAGATLRMLLSHRAGTWSSLLDHLDALADLPEDAPLPEQRAFVARAALASEPEAAPGEAYIYSNIGYVIAGAVLERATGVAWEALIQQRLFDPLSMTSCGFGAPTGDAPWGHATAGDSLTPVAPGPGADNPPFLGPAGTVHCSLPDWAAFALAHLERDPALVSAGAYDALHAAYPGGDYALGWATFEHPRLGAALAHDGSNTMWYARVVVAPQLDRVLLVAANAADAPAIEAIDEATQLLIELAADR